MGAESYVRAADADDLLVEEIRDIFVSMPHSLLALFQIVTGGENWAHMEYVLRSMSVIYSFMLLLYVCLMLLAMMNIVTGIFVNDAIEGAQRDVDLQAQSELERSNKVMDELKRLFRTFDSDGSCAITKDEFEKHMVDESVKSAFAVLDLEVADAMAFFEVLDTDGTQELDIDEFVMGCMYLKGVAKMVNVATLMRENKLMMSASMKTAHRLEERVMQLEDAVQDLMQFLTKSLDANAVAVPAAAKRANSFDRN